MKPSSIKTLASYYVHLVVLTNDTHHYTAQLNLVVAQENEALSTVQLYGALGGQRR
jgi:hypothetical protein